MNDYDAIVDNAHRKPIHTSMFWSTNGGKVIDDIQVIPEEATMVDILTDLGIFSSRSQARKAGWDAIPPGWTDIKVGKFKTRICILNPIK